MAVFRGRVYFSIDHEQRVQPFREGRVGEDAVFERGVGKLAHHGDLQHRHDLAAFDGQNGGPKDLPGVGIDDGLDKAAWFGRFHGTRHPAHRDLGDADRAALCPCLLLGQADPAELRVDVHGVGNQSVLRRRLPAAQQIVADDAIVVVRDVRERRTAVDVAQSVDTGDVRLQPIVYRDEAAASTCMPAAARLRCSLFGTRPAATSRWEPATVRSPAGPRSSKSTPEPLACTATASVSSRISMPSIRSNLQTSAATSGSSRLRSCLPCCTMVTAAAEAAKHLAEFQTDVTASQNQQMFRQLWQLHDRSGVESFH